jgi:hypothetical protein
LPSWTRALSAALVFLLGLTLSAVPAAAGPRPAVPAKPTLAAAAAAKLAAAPVSSRALAQTTPAPDTPSEGGKSFFKRPAGVAAIVLMVAGTGWMVYSAYHDNDPVHSPFR